MLLMKYPQLKKPVKCVNRMGLFETIRDIQFHRNLAKEDERMLHLQWKLDGIEEGELRERDKWQGVVTEKEAENERLRLEIAELRAKSK